MFLPSFLYLIFINKFIIIMVILFANIANLRFLKIFSFINIFYLRFQIFKRSQIFSDFFYIFLKYFQNSSLSFYYKKVNNLKFSIFKIFPKIRFLSRSIISTNDRDLICTFFIASIFPKIFYLLFLLIKISV